MSGKMALGWKRLFYGPFLSTLRLMPPERSDAIMECLGRVSTRIAWSRREQLNRAVLTATSVLQVTPAAQTSLFDGLAAQSARMLARDCLISNRNFDQCFHTSGYDTVSQFQRERKGAILLGCHLG